MTVYVKTSDEVGELCRHWSRRRADRAAARANAGRVMPTVDYRCVRRDRRWCVIAFQNVASRPQ